MNKLWSQNRNRKKRVKERRPKKVKVEKRSPKRRRKPLLLHQRTSILMIWKHSGKRQARRRLMKWETLLKLFEFLTTSSQNLLMQRRSI